MAEVNIIAWLLLITPAVYLVVIFMLWLRLGRMSARHDSASQDVFVSVVVACRDEEKNLPALLDDLAGQDYNPGKYEVIIVDDNSTDTTLELASSFKGIWNYKVVSNQGRGKKSAIKNGIRASKGELVLMTDADCRMGRGWIRSVVRAYADGKPDLIISPVVLSNAAYFHGKFQQLDFLSLQGVTAASALADKPFLCNGANLAVPSRVYSRNSNNLHEELISGDDIFLLQSIKKSGGKIAWNGDTESVVTAGAASGLLRFLRQRARWLSKAGAYDDKFSIIISFITLFTSVSLASLMVGSISVPEIIPFLIAAFAMKSLPDLLILYSVTSYYKKKNLLWWFLPAQVLYPFYVITVLFFSLFRRQNW